MKISQREYVRPGTIRDWAGPFSSIPSGWFPCDGRLVSRTTYKALFDIIGTTYGSGDGSTTFAIPDRRGVFPRGADNMGTGAAARDPDAGSRTAQNTGGNTGNNIGTYQGHMYGSHTHASTGNAGPFGVRGAAVGNAGAYSGLVTADVGKTEAAGGNENRPVNQNAMFIIKF